MNGRWKLSTGRKAWLAWVYAYGMSTRQMAIWFNISRSGVCVIARKRVPMRRPR